MFVFLDGLWCECIENRFQCIRRRQIFIENTKHQIKSFKISWIYSTPTESGSFLDTFPIIIKLLRSLMHVRFLGGLLCEAIENRFQCLRRRQIFIAKFHRDIFSNSVGVEYKSSKKSNKYFSSKSTENSFKIFLYSSRKVIFRWCSSWFRTYLHISSTSRSL